MLCKSQRVLSRLDILNSVPWRLTQMKMFQSSAWGIDSIHHYKFRLLASISNYQIVASPFTCISSHNSTSFKLG